MSDLSIENLTNEFKKCNVETEIKIKPEPEPDPEPKVEAVVDAEAVAEAEADVDESISYEETTICELKKLLDNDKDHKEERLKLKTTKDVHIYSKINNLTGQQMGPLIEFYIKEKFCMEKNKAGDCIGDCKDRFLEDNEIKASGGGKNHNSYNYVQIRVNHKIHNYIFTAYYLTKDNYMNGGELFIFKIKKENLYSILNKYGAYAHGTISKLGKITLEDLKKDNNTKEYSLRPKYGSKLWKELVEYRVNESDL